MAPHSSTLAWKIPWMEEPGRLQSMGVLRVGHSWATSLSLFTFMHWRRKWQPTPVFLPGEFQGRGAWWAAVYGVTQSQTQLKWLRSSSSRASFVGFCQTTYHSVLFLTFLFTHQPPPRDSSMKGRFLSQRFVSSLTVSEAEQTLQFLYLLSCSFPPQTFPS